MFKLEPVLHLLSFLILSPIFVSRVHLLTAGVLRTMSATVAQEPNLPAHRGPADKDGSTVRVASTSPTDASDRQAPAENDGLDVSDLAMVARIHGLVISSLELALSLINALDEDAFRFDSRTSLVFGGSAAIEAVGFVFAMLMAQRVDGTGGSPLMVMWEARLSRSVALMKMILFCGVVPQLIVLFACYAVYDFKAIDGSFGGALATFLVFMSLLWFVLKLRLGFPRNHRFSIVEVAFEIVCYTIPIIVEISECILILSSRSPSPASYVLAILDLFLALPALVFLTSFLTCSWGR